MTRPPTTPSTTTTAGGRNHWRVVHAPPERVAVPFSFTSGLDRLGGHPDIVVLDMPAPSAETLLDTLGAQVRAGRRWCPGAVLDGLHDCFRFALLEVRDREFLLDLAQWDVSRWRNPAKPLLQLVWPDVGGTLPWELGYDPGASGLRQPLLGPWRPRRA